MKFFKTARYGKLFFRMLTKWFYFFEMSFNLIFEAFGLKIRNNIELERSVNMIKKKSVLGEKRFILLKGIFFEVGGRKTSR